MKSDNNRQDSEGSLRDRAERIVQTNGRPPADSLDKEELIHELQVHQAELELQNEQIRESLDELSGLKRRYFDFFESAPVGYFVLDHSMIIREVNRAGLELLNQGRGAVIGSSIRFYAARNSLIVMNDHFEELVSTENAQDFEVELSRDGAPLWVHLSCKFLDESEDSKQTVLVTMLDITEKKEQASVIAEGKREYAEIVETANSIIAKTDLRGKLTFINRFGLDLFGYTFDELIGKPLIGSIVPEVESTGRDLTILLNRIFTQPRDSEADLEIENMRADGSRLWVSWRNRLMKDQEGNTVGILGVGQDITRRKEAEHIIRRDKEDLEELVRNRSEALIETQKELARSKRFEELGTMSASVAHELRRPLAALKLSLYNIRRKRREPSIDKHIDNCDLKVAEAEEIISKLMESSSLKKPVVKSVSIYRIISGCITELKSQNPYRQVKIRQKLKPLEDVDIWADPAQIREVVYNILQNGVEAVYDSSGTVTVEGFVTEDTVGFRVKDTDNGIPADRIEKVTEPFYTTKHTGIGLGLTIAKEIIATHRGELKFESSVGSGTTVTVSLPRSGP